VKTPPAGRPRFSVHVNQGRSGPVKSPFKAIGSEKCVSRIGKQVSNSCIPLYIAMERTEKARPATASALSRRGV